MLKTGGLVLFYNRRMYSLDVRSPSRFADFFLGSLSVSWLRGLFESSEEFSVKYRQFQNEYGIWGFQPFDTAFHRGCYGCQQSIADKV